MPSISVVPPQLQFTACRCSLFTPSNLRRTFQTVAGQRTDAAPNVGSIINLQSKTTPPWEPEVSAADVQMPQVDISTKSMYIYNIREVISKLCLTVSDWPSSTCNSQYSSLYILRTQCSKSQLSSNISHLMHMLMHMQIIPNSLAQKLFAKF